MLRSELISELANKILAIPLHHPIRVGVSAAQVRTSERGGDQLTVKD